MKTPLIRIFNIAVNTLNELLSKPITPDQFADAKKHLDKIQAGLLQDNNEMIKLSNEDQGVKSDHIAKTLEQSAALLEEVWHCLYRRKTTPEQALKLMKYVQNVDYSLEDIDKAGVKTLENMLDFLEEQDINTNIPDSVVNRVLVDCQSRPNEPESMHDYAESFDVSLGIPLARIKKLMRILPGISEKSRLSLRETLACAKIKEKELIQVIVNSVEGENNLNELKELVDHEMEDSDIKSQIEEAINQRISETPNHDNNNTLG